MQTSWLVIRKSNGDVLAVVRDAVREDKETYVVLRGAFEEIRVLDRATFDVVED